MRTVAAAAPRGTAHIAWALLRGLARKIAEVGRHEVDCAIEKHRMNRTRRDPAALAARLKAAKNLLIVCHGNIIRSAFATRLVTDAVGGRGSLSVASAGLEAIPGDAAHPIAASIATRLGTDLGHHVAARIEPQGVAKADVIFVMEIGHLVTMRKRFPNARSRTFLLTCLAPDRPLEIRDPYDRDEAVFEACFGDITRAVHPIIRMLSDAGLRSDIGEAPPDRREISDVISDCRGNS